MLLHASLISVLFCSVLSSSSTDFDATELVRVETTHGPILGFRDKLPALNRPKGPIEEVNVFLGIPFAKPPIGSLRFEKPEEPEHWDQPLETTEFSAGCAPHHPIAGFDYDEDCLYLNVFAPTRKSPEKNGYPVLVYIHGGGFCTGSTSAFGYVNVSDNFVSQGIVVITIQYRLGMLGFFSNGDSIVPGNLGLWDQRQALIWIQKNVNNFGGDPDRVTLWGQSAGSASTSMHSMSNHSKGLFHQMILHSGSPYAHWATNEHVVEMSRDLAKQAGCGVDDSVKMKSCLQELELSDIMDAASEFPLIRDQLAFLNYNPRMDGDFFAKDHLDLVKESLPMPTMIGFNTHEAAFLTIEFPNSVIAFRGGLTVPVESYANYNRTVFNQFIEQHVASGVDELSEDEQQYLAKELSEFYSEEWINVSDWKHFLEQYTLLASDVAFIVPAIWEAKHRAQAGSSVFLFQFDHVNSELKKQLPFRAVAHAAEHPYIFGNHLFGSFEMNRQDRKAQKRVTDAFGNFVKTGNPSTRQMKWSPVEPGKPIRVGVLKAVPQLSIRSEPIRRANFWTDLDKAFEMDIIRGVRKDNKFDKGNLIEARRVRKTKKMN